MTDKGQVVSKTVRGKLESQVLKISGKQGEVFQAVVLWQGGQVDQAGPFYDADEAEAKADQLRDRWFREKFSLTKK